MAKKQTEAVNARALAMCKEVEPSTNAARHQGRDNLRALSRTSRCRAYAQRQYSVVAQQQNRRPQPPFFLMSSSHVSECNKQVLASSRTALVELAGPLERWQASSAALLDDMGTRLAAPQMPHAAAVACQARCLASFYRTAPTRACQHDSGKHDRVLSPQQRRALGECARTPAWQCRLDAWSQFVMQHLRK